MARIVVAMSGGVDSSVAAALAARGRIPGMEGPVEAIGVTLKLMPKLESGFGCCGSPKDVDDAKRVCDRLGIAHYLMDMAELFDSKVIAPFVEGYLKSETPNPCVECNRSVKFGYLMGLADAWKADKVATGHYARIVDGRLLQAVDKEKDQTYFLHSLTEKELSRVVFPVGDLQKSQVRDIAREFGLETAEKPESQEICFVPSGDYRTLLKDRRPEAMGKAGEIQDAGGRKLGTHSGLENFTIGQRRGIGVAGVKPFYVTRMDRKTNTVTIGEDKENYKTSLIATRVSFTDSTAPFHSAVVKARIRHRHAPAEARLTAIPAGVQIDFMEPQRAITPGQSIVFYQGERVFGGGTIREVL